MLICYPLPQHFTVRSNLLKAITPEAFFSFASWYATFYFNCDISTTPKAIFMIGLIFFFLSLAVLCFWIRVPIVSIMIGFFLTFFSWKIALCWQFAHIPFIIIGIVLMIQGITLGFTKRVA